MSREFKEPCPDKRARNAAAVRRYRERNPLTAQQLADKRDYDRKYLYGVSIQEIEQHLHEQGGVCKICETELLMSVLGTRSRNKKPHVDHCHTTGAYRGILCHSCNVGIGMFRDSPVALTNAIKYLS